MMEKTEQATPYKLKKAKEKGQVNKSIELNQLASLITSVVLIMLLWPKTATPILQVIAGSLTISANIAFNFQTVAKITQYLLHVGILLFLPLSLVIIATVIFMSIIQSGFVLSFTPLKPDFKRLNPITGLKKRFSISFVVQFFKTILKLLILIIITTLYFKHQISQFLSLPQKEVQQYPLFLKQILLNLCMLIIAGLIIIAAIDMWLSNYLYMREQKMTKQEVKEEYKQREGHPEIKKKRKQLQRALLKTSTQLNSIKEATLLVTNPIHLAIALKYDIRKMPAPMITCVAKDKQVIEAKKIANKHHIPIIQNKQLARALFKSGKIDHYIDKQFFPIVAEIMRPLFNDKEVFL